MFPDLFPDHAAVCGFFRFPGDRPCAWTWISPKPKPIPWNQVDIPAWHVALDASWIPTDWTCDPTLKFRKWSHQVESSLHTFVSTPHGRIPQGCGGVSIVQSLISFGIISIL